jgi:hypothetical protein
VGRIIPAEAGTTDPVPFEVISPDGKQQDFSFMFAGYVNESHPFVQTVMQARKLVCNSLIVKLHQDYLAGALSASTVPVLPRNQFSTSASSLTRTLSPRFISIFLLTQSHSPNTISRRELLVIFWKRAGFYPAFRAGRTKFLGLFGTPELRAGIKR